MRFNKLRSVFLAVSPLIDDDLRHNIVKIAVDPRGLSPSFFLYPQCTRMIFITYTSSYFDNVMTKLIINKRTDINKLTSIFFFFQ